LAGHHPGPPTCDQQVFPQHVHVAVERCRKLPVRSTGWMRPLVPEQPPKLPLIHSLGLEFTVRS
jgi:hypothetical protein